MNLRAVFRILGALIIFLSAALLIPVPIAIIDGDGSHWPLILAAMVGGLGGIVIMLSCAGAKMDLGHREGFAVVTLGWVLFGLVGALPYYFGAAVPSLMT